MQKDIIGSALKDYMQQKNASTIRTTSSLNEEDELPVSYLFRDFANMPSIEKVALAQCSGSILDIGCGAGSHSLYLQENGFDVTAIDQSIGAIEVCRQRGLNKAACSNLLDYTGATFDSLLLLMNGIGIVGKLVYLEKYLEKMKLLLNKGGQILLDSSDIIYMFDAEEDGGYWFDAGAPYYGEVQFEMAYKEQKGACFNWLYLDFNTLRDVAAKCGFSCECLQVGDHFDYLAKLSLH